jgi:GNAT superfamily N-acetyltransferase
MIEENLETSKFPALIEQNLAEYQIAMAHVIPGGEVHETKDLTWIATTIPNKIYNGVYRTSLNVSDADEKIQEIVKEFRSRRVPFIWQIGPSTTPANLAERLTANGFTHYEDEPGMALELSRMNEDFPHPSGLEISRIHDASRLNDWVSVWAYDAPSNALVAFQDIHQQLGCGDDKPWRYYLGSLDGRPVATSLLFLGSDVAAVHWVVTVPHARKRGIGAAMTLAALRDARQMGYEVSVLTASPLGAGIYKRIGFKAFCTIRKYEWTPHRHP